MDDEQKTGGTLHSIVDIVLIRMFASVQNKMISQSVVLKKPQQPTVNKQAFSEMYGRSQKEMKRAILGKWCSSTRMASKQTTCGSE